MFADDNEKALELYLGLAKAGVEDCDSVILSDLEAYLPKLKEFVTSKGSNAIFAGELLIQAMQQQLLISDQEIYDLDNLKINKNLYTTAEDPKKYYILNPLGKILSKTNTVNIFLALLVLPDSSHLKMSWLRRYAETLSGKGQGMSTKFASVTTAQQLLEELVIDDTQWPGVAEICKNTLTEFKQPAKDKKPLEQDTSPKQDIPSAEPEQAPDVGAPIIPMFNQSNDNQANNSKRNNNSNLFFRIKNSVTNKLRKNQNHS